MSKRPLYLIEEGWGESIQYLIEILEMCSVSLIGFMIFAAYCTKACHHIALITSAVFGHASQSSARTTAMFILGQSSVERKIAYGLSKVGGCASVYRNAV